MKKMAYKSKSAQVPCSHSKQDLLNSLLFVRDFTRAGSCVE